MHITDDRKIEDRKMKVPDFHFNFGRRDGILLKMLSPLSLLFLCAAFVRGSAADCHGLRFAHASADSSNSLNSTNL